MLIPVCNLSKYGNIFGSVQFGTKLLKFIDSDIISNRVLPLQDYLNCGILNIGEICTVVGKSKWGTYFVCFGDTMIYELKRDILLHYQVSNIKLSCDGKVLVLDKGLEDYSYLFPSRNINFIQLFFEYQKSSLGVAKKFFAKYNNKSCMVKFSKIDGRDIDNELIYKQVADILNVPCCNVYKEKYFGKNCIVSVFEYKRGVDQFQSFKSLNRPMEQIYNGLSQADKYKFDKMMILDFIMLQQDRHMSNIAVCNGHIYPLFDNGECLGVGTVGDFSNSFRRYVMHIDRNYIRSLINIDNKVLIKLQNILNKDQMEIVITNLRVLGLI